MTNTVTVIGSRTALAPSVAPRTPARPGLTGLEGAAFRSKLGVAPFKKGAPDLGRALKGSRSAPTLLQTFAIAASISDCSNGYPPYACAAPNRVRPGDHELFGFLTTEANAIVAPIHPKGIPVILTSPEEVDRGLSEEMPVFRRPK